MSRLTPHIAWRLAAVVAAGAMLAACSDRASTGPATSGPGFAILPPGYTAPPGHTPRFPDPEHVEVCKIGSSADFFASHFESSVAATQSTAFSLADGGCRVIAALEGPDGDFHVEETALPLGYELDSILVINNVGGTLDTTKVVGTDNVTIVNANNRSGGWLVEFFNSEIETPGEGCTRTIGYWKNWDGGGPQPDQVSQFLPISLGSVVVANTTDSDAILSISYLGGHPSNGISKLMAQLLAAKLNVAAGADDTDIASTIAAADAFLATHGQASWANLSKADKRLVNGWMSALDDYNNGITGPGHCGEAPVN